MNKDATPKHGKKEGFLSLFNCGSGKKSSRHGKPGTYVAPATPQEISDNNDYKDEVDSSKLIEVKATPGHAADSVEEDIFYTDLKVVGRGTFGVVYKAKLGENREIVAIKKVFDDKRYKNRELFFMRQLEHPNITDLKYFYYCGGEGCRREERYLNMILEYIPETLFSVTKCDGMYTKPLLEPVFIKLYMYQLFRSLNYIHSINICHRDIKPQNLLLDPITHSIKLCDFGSAKELLKNETNIAYICSRYYRAPELIFGAKDYTCQIDVWSAGCVMAELFQGHPIFPGATGPDQMVEIIRHLGTPTPDDIHDIHPNVRELRFPPHLHPLPWNKVFTKQLPSPDALDLVSQLLVYSPIKRILPLDACAHPFFDELRRSGLRLKNGRGLPPLFNFTQQEIDHIPSIKDRLMPPHLVDGTEELELSYIEPFPQTSGLESSPPEKEGLKARIVKIARDSFRRKSSQKEKRKSEEPSNLTGDLHVSGMEYQDHELETSGKEFESRAADQVETFDDHDGIPVDDLEAMEIEAPKKKKKGKKKSKASRLDSVEGDSALEGREDLNPVTSTPSKYDFPPPPSDDDDLRNDEENIEISTHQYSTEDGDLESSTKKVVKKKKVPTATLR